MTDTKATESTSDFSHSSVIHQARVVSMFCNGMATKDISKELGVPEMTINLALKTLTQNAALPSARKTFQACPDLVLGNVSLYQKYLHDAEALRESYQESLHRFKF